MNPPETLIDDLRLLEPPEPFHFPWRITLGVLAALLLLVWGWRWWRATRGARRQARASKRAYEDALAELQRLFALVDRAESRPYATESSGIIRRYLERRFFLRAPQRSTEEFLAEAQHSPKLTATQQEALGRFLNVCDLLKFAKTQANRAELKELHEAAVHFVLETRRAAEEVAS